ncbi:uncharacterized protein [Parasteatoda tepidariorum]|uniref:uncharacterized protein n=1 Tax=Parasteatoda tepidariorum TaxID=114398 RepID=UPI0039BD48E0
MLPLFKYSIEFGNPNAMDNSYVEVKSSARKLGLQDAYIFKQNNDPKHSTNVTREWLLYNAPRRLNTPPQSPDLNPLEHLWLQLEQEVRNNHITAPGFLAEDTSSSSSETDGYEMLEIEGELVSEGSNLTSDEEEEEANDSDDMEELSAEIEHSESSETDDEEVEILDRDDLVEVRAETEPKESSSSDDEDYAIVNR